MGVSLSVSVSACLPALPRPSSATDAAKSAADILLTEPGLAAVVTAVVEARKIFRRLQTYIIYRMAATIQIVLVLRQARAVMTVRQPPRASLPPSSQTASSQPASQPGPSTDHRTETIDRP